MPTLNDISGLVEELIKDNQERNERDRDLEGVFLSGDFTGKLYDAIRTQTKSSKQRKLLINICRKAIIDRTVLYTMLPDIRVDPPDNLPELDSMFWQQQIKRTIMNYWWEQTWRLDERMQDIAFNFALKGRAALQLFPNFEKKTVELWLRDPSTYYAVVSSGGGYQTYANEGIGSPPNGGYRHSPVLYIWKATGREILRDFPGAKFADVKDTSEMYQMVEYWDEKMMCRYIEDKTQNSLDNRSKFTYMRTPNGDEMMVEHNLGFVPSEYIQDINPPGRIDATSSIYHTIMLGENLNDLLLMNTEEHRRRLGSVLMIKDPLNVPSPWPENNAVVTVGPGGDAKYVSQIENPGDMGSHVEAVKQYALMALGTSGARFGELPSSGPWISKGITAAANVSVSDEVLLNRQRIATAIKNCDIKAHKMARKMFGRNKQKLTAASSAGKETMTFRFNDLPADFQHSLEVFPLAHDVGQTAVVLMQLRGQKDASGRPLISHRTLLEKLPGFDAAEEIRRVEEERAREMAEMQAMAAQQQQVEQQGTEAEAENYALERGAGT